MKAKIVAITKDFSLGFVSFLAMIEELLIDSLKK
jgi:hypothetical protein